MEQPSTVTGCAALATASQQQHTTELADGNGLSPGGLEIPNPDIALKPFCRPREVRRKPFGSSLPTLSRGDFKMLALKFAALALGAGTLITMLSPDFSSELLLAIVSCLS